MGGLAPDKRVVTRADHMRDAADRTRPALWEASYTGRRNWRTQIGHADLSP